MTDTVGAAQLAITADASGVEAGVSKAKKSLSTLGGSAKSAGKEASQGLDQVGAGGEKAAVKVDRATKQMIAKRGRAAYTGERSIGSVDAGATAVAVLIERLAAAWPTE